MPTEEEIAALLEQYYAEEQAKYGVPDDFPVDNLTADPALSIPLGGGSSVNPTLGFQNGMVAPGVAVRGGNNLSGYGNVEINNMVPQAVNAGISGDRFNVDANIPISNPKELRLRGETNIAGNIITADWDQMAKALLLQLNIPTN
jgi:hypothetical protein|tara:strand:+ start:400 stop:834 length:435 start_codon:yes stop_codon:yes gene_type:complete